MNTQQQANQYYKAAFDRWALELSYEKNHLIAKSIASYVVEQILKAVDNPDETYLMKYSVNYWGEVLEEVNKIRGYDTTND
jgi:hypothetical protein